MKKLLLALSLVFTLSLTGCSEVSDNKEKVESVQKSDIPKY